MQCETCLPLLKGKMLCDDWRLRTGLVNSCSESQTPCTWQAECRYCVVEVAGCRHMFCVTGIRSNIHRKFGHAFLPLCAAMSV